jgi:acetylornithine deacetylase
MVNVVESVQTRQLVSLTRKLIDIVSLSGEEEEVGRFIASYLESLGYRSELQEVGPHRFNVIATTEAEPLVVLSTHMDTVPPFIPSNEDDERVYGRGACDAKGIIAAQIAAAERLREQGVDEIGLLFTVDEEMGSVGARVANEHPITNRVRFLINGEPTENKLAKGTKGSLRLTIKTEGRAAHSAYPENGESAIEKLLDVLSSILKCQWPGDEFFGETTCNIGVISGGLRPNVVPAEAHADLQIRLVTEAAPVKTILERAIAGRAQVDYRSEHRPVRLWASAGFEQQVMRFTTDIPFLSNWGQPLLLGPGSILNAHTDHEFVTKRELAEAVELYSRLVQSLLGREKPEAPGEITEGKRG